MIETYFEDPRAVLLRGDMREALALLPEDSIDSVVTDPPYELGFMGKSWDSRGVAFDPETWRAVLRVLKPGGHLIAFGGSRTYHRIACAIEDAGFEIRDSIAQWIYGTGFPKSLDVSKAIDALDKKAERRRRDLAFTAWMRTTGLSSSRINEITSTRMGGHYLTDAEQPCVPTLELFEALRPHLLEVPAWVEQFVRERDVESENTKRRPVVGTQTMVDTTKRRAGFAGATYGDDSTSTREVALTTAATPDAELWSGWGTALKPSHEPMVLARKPLAKGATVASSVLALGTGAINVGACRVGEEERVNAPASPDAERFSIGGGWGVDAKSTECVGRWPANAVFQHAPGCCPVGEREVSRSVGHNVERADTPPTSIGPTGLSARRVQTTTETEWECVEGCPVLALERMHEDAPAFFYCAKPGNRERDHGLDAMPERTGGEITGREDGAAGLNSPRAGAGRTGGRKNVHPTVKPIELMQYYCRLVTPPGGLVLDCFTGSGSTGVAAIHEGFQFLGVERDLDDKTGGSLGYCEIIKARLLRALADTAKEG